LPPHTARNAVHVAVDVNSETSTANTVPNSVPLSNYVNSREPSKAGVVEVDVLKMRIKVLLVRVFINLEVLSVRSAWLQVR
jgi:hypothetical protein